MVSVKSLINAVVCLPTLNEEHSITQMISSIKNIGLPLFITDQQSTDATCRIAKQMGVEVYNRQGIGKGCGIQEAVKIADQKGYDTLVLIDCDMTYPADKIPLLLQNMPEYDMVTGVRNFNDIVFSHRIVNMIHTLVLNTLFNGKLKDINTGMRAFKIKYLRDLDAKGFDLEAEISCKALKRKLKIKEIPVSYRKRAGDSKIRIIDGWLILQRMFKERFTK